MAKTPVPQAATELDRIVGAIVDEADPLEVILFGSEARGDAGPHSDIDLLVVMPDGTRRGPTERALYQRLASVPQRTRAVDLLVATPALLEHERGAWWSVFDSAPRGGRPLYRRTEAGIG
jgi:predicted nucleotidyltransferase